MVTSFVKTGWILIVIAIVITIIFCVTNELQLKPEYYYYTKYTSQILDMLPHNDMNQTFSIAAKILYDLPHHEIDKNALQLKMIYNITNIVDTSWTKHDYNELFSHSIKKNTMQFSQSTKKIKMLVATGINNGQQNVLQILFNELSRTDPHHIIHLSETSQISKDLRDCWSYDVWGIKHTEHNHCDRIQTQLNEISANVSTNTVLLSSFLFPFNDALLTNHAYPDIVQLIEWTQNTELYPIDLHVLILNIDFNDSLSTNNVSERIRLMSHMLNALHAQIVQMDPLLWSIINYTDFVHNKMKYIPILKALLQYVDENKIITAIRKCNDMIDISQNDNNKTQLNALQLWAVYESYYSFHVRNRWPLLQQQKYTLNPAENKQIRVNYNDIYSNYIHKDYDLLDESDKKLTMVFIVGVEGVGHHFFRTLFNALQTLDARHYVHQKDRPWPQDPLWLYMDQCFAYDLFGSIKADSWLTVDIKYLPKYEQNISICKVVQNRINSYSQTMDNNSVLFMSTHYSFPYDDAVANRYPDFVKLIKWAQNAKPFAFDVRILVSNRDYKTSIISTCIKRFGRCEERIALLANMLNVIHAQLLQIDPQFWLQINYTDLVLKMTKYARILSSLFNVKLENIQKAIEITAQSYNKRKTKSSKPKKQIKQLSTKQLRAIQVSYYSWHVQNRWAFFSNNFYIVAPQNDAFLKQKLFASNNKSGLF